jgi:cyanate lyase
LTWEGLAKDLNCSPVFLCSVCLGENLIDDERAGKLCSLLNLSSSNAKILSTVHPTKARGDWKTLCQDPVINRLNEINLVYGMTIKELIHEKFGDGIMSAIDFEMEVEKVEDPEHGDRVKLVMSGKFLPFRKW